MEQTAVKQIADLAIAAQGNMPVQVDDGASIAIVPEGFKIHSTEKFNDFRDRFRGTFATTSIPAFVQYVTDRNNTDVRTFIDTARGLIAKTIFNLGNEFTAGHADDIALLRLEKQPEFLALERANGQRFRQQDLIDWVDDWADFVTAHNESGPIPTEKAIRALQKVKIQKGHEVDSQVRDLGYQASVTEKMEATGTDENLPTHFVMRTESFKGLPVEDLKISFRISTKDDAPTFLLRHIGKDAHDQRRADQFVNILETELLGLGEFYQGTFEA